MFTMLGASMNDGVLAFNQFTRKLSKSDSIGVILGVGLDVCDSIQRGVSTSGVIVGGALTAVKGVGLIYANKVILYHFIVRLQKTQNILLTKIAFQK